jgi:hypothetical protein
LSSPLSVCDVFIFSSFDSFSLAQHCDQHTHFWHSTSFSTNFLSTNVGTQEVCTKYRKNFEKKKEGNELLEQVIFHYAAYSQELD